jgi:hypothetical protein
MKKEVSPVAAVVLVLVVVGVVALAYWRFGGVTRTSDKPPAAMPPGGAEEWNKYTQGRGAGPGGGSGGSTIPGGVGGKPPGDGGAAGMMPVPTGPGGGGMAIPTGPPR